ncbi:Xpo1 protein [Capsaspora owczarzaki ATCC 30864]|uniref:Xpo1 protein n=1 Tax=Capsaspora owczarzaki (strain ATCC 30864) TaxID=595528 RepID=UPI0003525475|nr:Xpo1 protein [Capsaspora owczarzaki ATCC 30864]|eukprot:XP_004349359.2 Xpo1 protein [Capsaspora owczarzaki ATCC 30864]
MNIDQYLESGRAVLFNFDDKFDVASFDRIVDQATQSVTPYFQAAQQLVTEFVENPDSWTRVDAILSFSVNPISKFYGLNALRSMIKTRWKVLPREQCENIKKFMIDFVTKCSIDDAALIESRLYRTKLDETLVAIVKHEWPAHWPNFIEEIVGASRTNLAMCENNMIILKLLSEEVFDYSSGQITLAKAKQLKQQMCEQFTTIFELCQLVLVEANKASLIEATLGTLQSFLSWIPIGYIFETELISILLNTYFPNPLYRNLTLKCLSEIGSLDTGNQYEMTFVNMYSGVLTVILETLTPELDISEAYMNSDDDERKFVQDVALFLSSFFRQHSKVLEARPEMHELLLAGMFLVARISDVEETELFKVCLEFWNWLSHSLYVESPFGFTGGALMLNGGGFGRQGSPRRELYTQLLSRVRTIMITRMAKPEEVLIVQNDEGDYVRELTKDTDSINIYKSARETLVYLTHLDCSDTEVIMSQRLSAQVHDAGFSPELLNTLCWAIGSISGAMSEEDEKRFLVTVIRELLGLCEFKRGKENKAVIASNIMYIVGQYPRFLRAHWKFLKTVVQKLFEFMHELHEGVQDMACDTFIKIAQKCRKHFVTLQAGEETPYIDKLLAEMNLHINDLQEGQVQTFFEAVGYMIASPLDPQTRDRLIERFMLMPNNHWIEIVARVSSDISALSEPPLISQLLHVLRLNNRACLAIGHTFVSQLGKIYLDLLNIYKAVSDIINSHLRQSGDVVLTYASVNSLVKVRRESLRLIETWVARTEDPLAVRDSFVPHLLELVFLDYQQCEPSAREPEVLRLLTTIVKQVQGEMCPVILDIFPLVFECTLDMINKELTLYPELRVAFFNLLQQICEHCYPALFQIPEDQFRVVMDSLTWAMQHTMRDVADTGLLTLKDFLERVATLNDPNIVQGFFRSYYLLLLQHLFACLTNSLHAASFKMHATVLSVMFRLVFSGVIQAPLFNPAEYPEMDNPTFVKQFMQVKLQEAFPHLKLQEAFPHLAPLQIEVTVLSLSALYGDASAFKSALRDFLVQIKAFANEEDLFLEETEAMQQLEQLKKKEEQTAVLGILKPGERDDMLDMNQFEDHTLEV